MSEKHLAIFKGEVRENHWHVVDNISELNYAKSNFALYLNGQGYVTKLEANEYSKAIDNFERKISLVKLAKGTVLEFETIWSGEMNKPILNVYEEIWINDLELLVMVSKKYRTTDGEVIYETNHLVRAINTESTEESRLKAVDKWFELSYPDLEKFEQLHREFLIDEIIEELDGDENGSLTPEPIPTWEVKEKPKKNTWFGGWFSKK